MVQMTAARSAEAAWEIRFNGRGVLPSLDGKAWYQFRDGFWARFEGWPDPAVAHVMRGTPDPVMGSAEEPRA